MLVRLDIFSQRLCGFACELQNNFRLAVAESTSVRILAVQNFAVRYRDSDAFAYVFAARNAGGRVIRASFRQRKQNKYEERGDKVR